MTLVSTQKLSLQTSTEYVERVRLISVWVTFFLVERFNRDFYIKRTETTKDSNEQDV